METWRIIATALLALPGIVLVPVVMAKVRDRTHSSGQVAVSGAVTCTALLLLGLLTFTVLPPVVAWTAVVVLVTAVSVMLLAS
ncbi:hypothetical protein [Amycolatopsis nigrescens]|uniref:hypothetical protein n=1 Tax=Amycolatopsis nigrescens TaxID=381445 RepID=UPI00036AAE4C|nr:hypothetical protein [Amycolatopsis nigrescens]